MPNIGFPELILILVIALIIFGPGKLPSIGGAIGKAIGEFKKASKELIHGGSEEQVAQKVVEPAVVSAPVSATPVVATETATEKA